MTPAWRVAAALALACELDWGRWAAGWTAPSSPRPRPHWRLQRRPDADHLIDLLRRRNAGGTGGAT